MYILFMTRTKPVIPLRVKTTLHIRRFRHSVVISSTAIGTLLEKFDSDVSTTSTNMTFEVFSRVARGKSIYRRIFETSVASRTFPSRGLSLHPLLTGGLTISSRSTPPRKRL